MKLLLAVADGHICHCTSSGPTDCPSAISDFATRTSTVGNSPPGPPPPSLGDSRPKTHNYPHPEDQTCPVRLAQSDLANLPLIDERTANREPTRQSMRDRPRFAETDRPIARRSRQASPFRPCRSDRESRSPAS